MAFFVLYCPLFAIIVYIIRSLQSRSLSSFVLSWGTFAHRSCSSLAACYGPQLILRWNKTRPAVPGRFHSMPSISGTFRRDLPFHCTRTRMPARGRRDAELWQLSRNAVYSPGPGSAFGTHEDTPGYRRPSECWGFVVFPFFWLEFFFAPFHLLLLIFDATTTLSSRKGQRRWEAPAVKGNKRELTTWRALNQ